MNNLRRPLAVLCLAAMLAGCATTGPAYDPADVRDASGHLPGDDCEHGHNDAGGYAPACGALPGLLGDDC